MTRMYKVRPEGKNSIIPVNIIGMKYNIILAWAESPVMGVNRC